MSMVRQIILEELTRTDRPNKATFEKEKVFRPPTKKHQAILSYEIYSKTGNPTEHETILTLNKLVEKGKVESLYYREFLWYKLKEEGV